MARKLMGMMMRGIPLGCKDSRPRMPTQVFASNRPMYTPAEAQTAKTMDTNLNLDFHYFLRAAGLGAYMFLVVFALQAAEVLKIGITSDLSAFGTFIAAIAIGFLTDILSPYKAHPIYIYSLRDNFFLDMSDIRHGGKPPERMSPKDRAEDGEDYLEEVIDGLDPDPRMRVRIEHAIWIILFNASIISLLAAIAVIAHAGFVASLTLQTALAIVILLGAAALMSSRAMSRNMSMGKKYLRYAKERAVKNLALRFGP